MTFSCPSVKWNISIKADSPVFYVLFLSCWQWLHFPQVFASWTKHLMYKRAAGRRQDCVFVTSFSPRRNTCVRAFKMFLNVYCFYEGLCSAFLFLSERKNIERTKWAFKQWSLALRVHLGLSLTVSDSFQALKLTNDPDVYQLLLGSL